MRRIPTKGLQKQCQMQPPAEQKLLSQALAGLGADRVRSVVVASAAASGG
jgi:hypothetical protein